MTSSRKKSNKTKGKIKEGQTCYIASKVAKIAGGWIIEMGRDGVEFGNPNAMWSSYIPAPFLVARKQKTKTTDARNNTGRR